MKKVLFLTIFAIVISLTSCSPIVSTETTSTNVDSTIVDTTTITVPSEVVDTTTKN